MDEVIVIDTRLHSNTTTVDFCQITKEKSTWYPNDENNKEAQINWTNVMETILSTRIPKEFYGGIFVFMRSLRSNASANEIESALVGWKKE